MIAKKHSTVITSKTRRVSSVRRRLTLIKFNVLHETRRTLYMDARLLMIVIIEGKTLEKPRRNIVRRHLSFHHELRQIHFSRTTNNVDDQNSSLSHKSEIRVDHKEKQIVNARRDFQTICTKNLSFSSSMIITDVQIK